MKFFRLNMSYRLDTPIYDTFLFIRRESFLIIFTRSYFLTMSNPFTFWNRFLRGFFKIIGFLGGWPAIALGDVLVKLIWLAFKLRQAILTLSRISISCFFINRTPKSRPSMALAGKCMSEVLRRFHNLLKKKRCIQKYS